EIRDHVTGGQLHVVLSGGAIPPQRRQAPSHRLLSAAMGDLALKPRGQRLLPDVQNARGRSRPTCKISYDTPPGRPNFYRSETDEIKRKRSGVYAETVPGRNPAQPTEFSLKSAR